MFSEAQIHSTVCSLGYSDGSWELLYCMYEGINSNDHQRLAMQVRLLNVIDDSVIN